MQKDSAAWLIVRTLGLASLCISLYQVYLFSLNIIYVLIYRDVATPPKSSLRLVSLNWDPPLSFLLFSCLALYLLKRGKIIHQWLIHEGKSNESP